MSRAPAARAPALNWDDFRIVLVIAERGTLSAAAIELNLSHPTLSRRLQLIERRLGTRVFDRLPTHLQPTAAGQEMCALAMRLREDIAGLQRCIGGRDTSADGPIRLTAPDAVSEYLLPGVLAELCREHSGLTIDLVVSNEVLSLAQRAADVALRITPNPTESLHARRVGTVAMGIYTVQDADAPPQANDLLTRPWIGFDSALACSGPGQWVASHVAPEQIRFRANTLLGAAQAAKGGLGCCVLPCFVGGAIAELQRVGPALQELALPLWLMVHPDMVRLPRIRRACDALANKLVQAAPLLAGEP